MQLTYLVCSNTIITCLLCNDDDKKINDKLN